MRIATALIFVASIAACGGKLAPTPTATSDGDGPAVGRGGGAPGDAGVSPWSELDASTAVDDAGDAQFSSVANGPGDTNPECAMRPTNDCCVGAECEVDPNAAFDAILESCAAEVYYCGYANADVDAEGCATDLQLRADALPKYAACVTTLLNATRFTCIEHATQLTGYVDCTVPR